MATKKNKAPAVLHTVTVDITQEHFDVYVNSILSDLTDCDPEYDTAECEEALKDYGLTIAMVKADARVLAAFMKAAEEQVASSTEWMEFSDEAYGQAHTIFKAESKAAAKIQKAREAAEEKERAAERALIAKNGVSILVKAEHAYTAESILRAAGLL